MAINPNGLVIFEGPSKLDGEPIVVIATGLKSGSNNSKTGGMVQTYILRSDMTPQEAIYSGADESICGACPHRGDGTGKGRSCYVVIFQGPRGVYEAYKRGSYARATPAEAAEHCAGKMVRLGAYGDPAAVPIFVWQHLLKKSAGSTGYTHQFLTIAPQWAKIVMASADSVEDMAAAHALGYRTFRVTPLGEKPIKGLEIMCPASEEAGRKTTCELCKACAGTSGKAKISIQIAAHGIGRKHV